MYSRHSMYSGAKGDPINPDVLGCVHLTKLGVHIVLTELATHF